MFVDPIFLWRRKIEEVKYRKMGAASKTALTTTTLAVLLSMMSIFLATIPSDSFVTAQSFHPTGVRRGAYISIYGYKIGDLYTKDVQDGDVYQILGNATREEISLNFLKYWNFNAITIYQFDKVWKSTSLPAHLKSYIQRARAPEELHTACPRDWHHQYRGGNNKMVG